MILQSPKKFQMGVTGLLYIVCVNFLWISSGLCTHNVIDDILRNYTTLLRPVKNMSTTSNIYMDIDLFQIVNMDSKEQRLVTSIWIKLMWLDEYLQWEPQKYNGLTNLNVPPNMVWVPDVVLYNSIDERHTINDIFPDTSLRIFNNGVVERTLPILAQTSCSIDVTFYPFDIQICSLMLSSWSYSSDELDMMCKQHDIPTQYLVPDGEWVVKKFICMRQMLTYSCCEAPFSELNYIMILERQPLFYLFNLVFPCMLIVLPGLWVFLLPVESGEKASLSITVVLSVMVLMLIVMENVPQTSETNSLLQDFFCVEMLFLTLATLCTVMVTQIHFRGVYGSRPPYWMRKLFFVRFARVLGFGRIMNQWDKILKERVHKIDPMISYSLADAPESNDLPSDVAFKRITADTTNVILQTSNSATHFADLCGPEILNQNGEIQNSRSNSVISADSKRKRSVCSLDESDSIHYKDSIMEIYAKEWQLVAIVMDRMFFFFFILLNITLVVYVVVRSKQSSESVIEKMQRMFPNVTEDNYQEL